MAVVVYRTQHLHLSDSRAKLVRKTLVHPFSERRSFGGADDGCAAKLSNREAMFEPSALINYEADAVLACGKYVQGHALSSQEHRMFQEAF